MYISSKYDDVSDLFAALSYRSAVAVLEILLKYEAEPITKKDIAKLGNLDINIVSNTISNLEYAEVLEKIPLRSEKGIVRKGIKIKNPALSEYLKKILRLYGINNF